MLQMRKQKHETAYSGDNIRRFRHYPYINATPTYFAGMFTLLFMPTCLTVCYVHVRLSEMRVYQQYACSIHQNSYYSHPRNWASFSLLEEYSLLASVAVMSSNASDTWGV